MPTQKDFKRLVRARMRKTGEAYTTARARLLERQRRSPAPPPPDYAKLAGMADATIAARTGRTWEQWTRLLDRAGAERWPHREIAKHVHQTYQVPGWWTQTVTVGYERIKGLRAIGQRRGGGYEVNKSKVFAVPRDRLYRAFHDARTRRRWLSGVRLRVRTAVPGKSMRITWPDGTLVQWYFDARGSAKSQVAVQHTGLPDKAAADQLRAWWAERLAQLQTVLGGAPTRRTRRSI